MRTLVKLSWTEVKLFLRDPLTVLFSLALPLIILFFVAQRYFIEGITLTGLKGV